MCPKRPEQSQILMAIQAAARSQRTNPYQIAKASGMPLTTVQRLLTRRISLPLVNVEMLFEALGLRFQLVATAKTFVEAGTGRRHGLQRGRGR